MKKILYILLFITGAAKAQVDTTAPIQKWYGAGLEYKTLIATGFLRIPGDTFKLKQADSGAIAFKNETIWIWNGRNWFAFSADGQSLDTAGLASRNWVTSLFPRIDTLHQVAFSGSYNDLSNKPTIPTNNSQLANGAGYLIASDTSSLSDRIDGKVNSTNLQSLVSANPYVANSVAHYGRTDNPHNVTKDQVGLDNVINVDTARTDIADAINLRATKTYVDDGLGGKANTSHTHAFSDLTSGTSNLAVKNADNNFSASQSITGSLDVAGRIRQVSNNYLTIKPSSAIANIGLDFLDATDFSIGRIAQNTGTGDMLIETHGGSGTPEITLLYDTRGIKLSGPLRFSNYTAGFLKTDASGNVAVDNSTYAASTHTHAQSDITNLTTDLAGKQAQLNGTGLVRMSGTTPSYDNSSYVKRLFVNNTSASVTGTTSETTVYSYTIPAGTMGVNSSLHIPFILTWTNNANAKTFRIRINGTVVAQYGPTTNATGRFYFIISNRNSLSSQITGGASSQSTNLGFNAAITGGAGTYSFDFSQSQTITFTIQLGNSADAAAFEMLEGNLYP